MTLKDDIEKRISDLKVEEEAVLGQARQIQAKIGGLQQENNEMVSQSIAANARREELEELLGKLSIPEQNQETKKDKKTPSKEDEKLKQTS